jgi:hypothetical protein
VKQINVVIFQLKFLSFMKIHLVFHVSLLEIYDMTISLGGSHDSPPPPPIEVNGEQKYEMEDILNLRIFNHQLQYLIH